jgi:hypothetical protein
MPCGCSLELNSPQRFSPRAGGRRRSTSMTSVATLSPRAPTSGSWARRKSGYSTCVMGGTSNLAQHDPLYRRYQGGASASERAQVRDLGSAGRAAVAALGETADLHELIGPHRIEARITELSSLLKQGLKDAGATLVTPEDPALSGGVVVIEIPKENQKTVADAMYTKFGIAASTSGDCDSARTSTIRGRTSCGRSTASRPCGI